MKTTYVWSDTAHKFIVKPKREYAASSAHIHTFEPFKSGIDGKIINDKAQLANHDREHGVTDPRNYGPEYFERKNRERGAAIQGQTPADKQDRLNALKRATENFNRR